MSVNIHPTAIIETGAELGTDVAIGAYSVIGSNVKIGDGSRIASQVVIEGHTDSMGDDAYNLNLSRDRAFAIRQALVAEGIPASRISTQGFGEALPVASNSTSTGRQKNRRVEITCVR